MDKLRKLALDLARGIPVANFSVGQMEDAFRDGVLELITDEKGNISPYKWDENKNVIFSILTEMAEIKKPKEVRELFSKFAAYKSVANNQKVRFKLKKGKRNVKRFVTKVAPGGVYQRVRLDSDFFEVETFAYGGAVYQTFEGFLTGRESITEVLDIALQAFTEIILDAIELALIGAYSAMPAANKHTHTSLVEAEFNRILSTVRAYGDPVIMCSQQFANTLTPSANFIGEADKADMRNLGYIGRYLGAPVVILAQSFEDESNTVKSIDPSYCFIVPSGAGQEPIVVVTEGPMHFKQADNADWSVEIQFHQKVGVILLHTNHFGIYQNTSLT
jgi:hypothetical protein